MMWTKILIRQQSDGEYSNINDWLCVHNTREEGVCVIDPHLIDAKKEISTLTFSAHAGTDAATLLSPEHRDKCEVWVCEYINYDTDPWDSGYTLRRYHRDGQDENGKIWRLTMFVGHAVDYTPYYDRNGLLTYKILCVDNRDYLNKSIQERREYRLRDDGTQGNGGAVGYYKDFVARHNTQISGAIFDRDQMFANYGVNNVFNDYPYVVDWEQTYSSLQERFIERFGGELTINNNAYVDETPTVHYPSRTEITWVDDWGLDSDCVIQNGINLASLRITTDATEICTRLIPLGEMKEDGSKLTIENIEKAATETTAAKPLGQYYVDIADSAYIAAHGITCRTVEFDDITLEANLWDRAVTWLQENNRIRKTYEAEVLDLAANGGFDPLLRLRCGDRHVLRHSTMGVNETLQIIRIDYDLAHLHKVSVTFGDKYYNDIEQGLAKDTAQTAKVDKVVYNNATVTTTLDQRQKALTSKQEYDTDSYGFGTISGKEITLTLTQGSGSQEVTMGKFGLVADQEGIAGYSGTSSNPSFILTYYGQFITDGQIYLRNGTTSDLIIKVNGTDVSLRQYIASHP